MQVLDSWYSRKNSPGGPILEAFCFPGDPSMNKTEDPQHQQE